MRRQYELDEFMDELADADFVFGEIASGTEVLKLIKRNYYSRQFIDADARYEDSTPTSAGACFTDLYKDFVSRRLAGYTRIYDMMLMEYNPLENYDRIEEGAIVRSTEYGEKVTNSVDTKRNESISTPRVEITTKNFIVGYNEDEPHLAGQTVTNANGSNEVNDTIVSQNSGGETYTEQTHTDTETERHENFRVHGNIGVTTPAQMIMGELDIRGRFDLVKAIVRSFVDEVSFYC